MKKKVQDNVNIDFEDFLDLGEHYFWYLEWIDPFTGIKHNKHMTLRSRSKECLKNTFERLCQLMHKNAQLELVTKLLML